MDGVFNICKPVGISSGRTVYRVRDWTGVRKSGHAGSLDPAADGVLLVCQGHATKSVEACMGLPKTYRVRSRLDLTSLSYDAEKGTTQLEIDSPPDRATVEAVLRERFTGIIEQTPPAFSAVKINGRSAYKIARTGQPIEMKPRPVTIYALEIDCYAFPELDFTVTCGRGTYIRALIRDIGRALATGGCLTGLTRSAVGPFTLETSIPAHDLDSYDPSKVILPLDRLAGVLEAYFDQNPRFRPLDAADPTT